MKILIAFILACVLATSLTACSTWNRRDTGMAAGGVIGGVAGNALTGGSAVGTIGGAVVGGFAGRELAR